MRQDEDYLRYKKGREEQIKDWAAHFRIRLIPSADFGLTGIQLRIFPREGNSVYPGVFEVIAYGSLMPLGVVFEQYFQLIQQWSNYPLFEKLDDYSFFREVPPEPAELLESPNFEKAILEYPHPALTDFARIAIPEPTKEEDYTQDEANYDLLGLTRTRLPVYLTSATCFGIEKTACNIPPHNLAEIVDVLEAKMLNPKESSELMPLLHGPDFSCGGTVIFDSEEAKNSMYSTGRGKYKFKCDYSIVDKSSSAARIAFKVIDSSFALKNLNLTLAQGILSGVRSASVSLDDAVEVLLEENQDLENTTRTISDLPGFTIELVYNSTLFLNRENRKCEQLPLESLLELFIDNRIKYLTTRHRCSRQEAVKLYSAELSEIKGKFSKPRLTKISYL